MNRLLQYLDENGILLCNINPYLPALEDIGCCWSDVTELIDKHQLFYCKVFKKRTTYLSKEVYYLLKKIRTERILTQQAEHIYHMLEGNPPLETGVLKAARRRRGRAIRRIAIAVKMSGNVCGRYYPIRCRRSISRR